MQLAGFLRRSIQLHYDDGISPVHLKVQGDVFSILPPLVSYPHIVPNLRGDVSFHVPSILRNIMYEYTAASYEMRFKVGFGHAFPKLSVPFAFCLQTFTQTFAL